MTDIDTVQTFFAAYARALSDIDLDALAEAYAYPSLAVSRLGRQVIDAPETTRAFFAANGAAYHARGIAAVRIVRPRPAFDEDGLWVGLADLENLGAAGEVVGVERNAYQLVRESGSWRIAVTTPLDAR